jgi:biotin carboxylase
MKTVLLCDAAFSAMPILAALRRRGFRVAVCGSRENDPGHAVADVSLVLDYSNRERLLSTVRSERFDFLVPGCTDVSYLSCARIAAELGLPGYDSWEVARAIHRKDEFRQISRKHGFPVPRWTSSVREASELRFPILVKPSDSFSGRGIVKVHDPLHLAEAIERSRSQSREQSVVFEEFVSGNLYSHSAFVAAGRIVADFFVNEYCTVYPYQVNSSHVAVDLDTCIVRDVRKWLEAFAAILNIADGLVHTQFISDGASFWLIEVTRRCPGDLYSQLIERATGRNHADMYAVSFCNAAIVETPAQEGTRFVSRHTVSVERECTFLSCCLAVADARVSFVPLKKTGEKLHAAPADRAGIYFVEHQSASRMTELTPKLRELVTVESF